MGTQRAGHIQIPGVELMEELGRGAYSIVYAGRQGTTPCAVKIPRKRGRWTQWVYREAVALARVRHAGLPTVLEVGEAQGLPYLVMELVEGETLAERLRRGPLDERRAIEVATHLASALAAVHDAGLIHRDLKPRNIILEGSGLVRLVDFGFATPMERAAVVDGAGTPDYAAPEQLRTPSRLDGRTDLFALGRVLFECLTGQLPPRDGSGGASGVRVSELTAAGATEGCARVVAGLIAHDPDARYPDAHAVLVDLSRAARTREVLGPRGFEPTRYEPPLVARDEERGRLMRAVSGLETTRGALTLVKGSRGSGKSRLVLACAQMLRTSGRKIVTTTCQEGDPPLSALRALFEAYLDSARRLGRDERTRAEKAIRSAAENLEPLAVLIAPEWGALLGKTSAPSPTFESFLEGAAELVIRLTRFAGALVMAVDDVQWIDVASRDILARVASRLDEAPLGIVLAMREGGLPPEVEALLSAHPSRTTTIALEPFSADAIAELVAEHLGTALVEPGLVDRVSSLSDRTPLGVLEVLGALLDVGALRPQGGAWFFDEARAEAVRLPEGALTFLGRRLNDLPEATRRVLEAAAVLGTTFSDDLLSRSIALDLEYLGYAIATARRAGILGPLEEGRHRFLHDSLREMLLEGAGEAERRRLHQNAAEVFDDGGTDPDRLHRAAFHYEAGLYERTPRKALRAARIAMDAALTRYDNEAAIHLIAFARKVASGANLPLDGEFYRKVGEAHLRVGAVDDSLRSFAEALDVLTAPVVRAEILGRMAWVHAARGESAAAWTALGRAFEALGERMPTESPVTVAHAATQIARYGLRRLARRSSSVTADEQRAIEILCELHFQNARLGAEGDKPLRLIQSTLEMVERSHAIGPSRTLARAQAIAGFVLTAVSRREAGDRLLASARALAVEQNDPVTIAFCIQQQGVAASFSGELDRALDFLRECVDDFGPWIEFNELCGIVFSAEIIESLRGRSSRALPWLSRALERHRRGRNTNALFLKCVLYRAQAAYVTLGRDADADAWLLEQLRVSAAGDGDGDDVQGPRDPLHRKVWWGARMRIFADSGDLGPEFEAHVQAFEAERINPKTSHPVLGDLYVGLAHARIHQCLRGTGARHEYLAKLKSAARDLRLAVKSPVLDAHAHFVEGCVAHFSDDRAAAQTAWGKAEALAIEHTCPWVLYALARVRAHMLRAQGKLETAREQARFAEMLAHEHGAAHRARWIREEFGLSSLPLDFRSRTSMGSRSSRRARRQLAALLDVLRLPRAEVEPRQQAASVLEELLRHLDAERGILYFHPSLTTEAVHVSRARRVEDWSDADGWRDTLVQAVKAKGEPWPPDVDDDPLWLDQASEADPTRVVVLPLFLRDRTVGAIFLERGQSALSFNPDDRVLVDVLSHQVPIALELARLVAEQEQVQASLQHAQKLESLGRLAGGLAHDFNNMLFAIQGSASLIREQAELEGELAGDLEVILDATDRAAKLTKQLLSFSRHQTGPLVACDPALLVKGLEAMLRRVAGSTVTVTVAVDAEVHPILSDPASLEQALVNLVINAKDAMPEGGTLTIATRNVVLGEDAVRRGAPALGEAGLIEVSDTGTGMSREVMGRIFEPFFTTKAKAGTGLGLATLYAFVKNCGGHVEVASELGRGTTFRLWFRRATLPRIKPKEEAPISKRLPRATGSTILVVDDDESVRRSTRRMLEHNGYHVLDASNAEDALSIMRARRDEIALMIVDVVMPGTSGPELARSLLDLEAAAKVLFVSGFAPASQGGGGKHDVSGHVLLEKPFSATDLLARVEALLPVAEATPAG